MRLARVPILLVIVLSCVAALPARPEAQANQSSQATATAVRILATGSFLGQFDGMFELPSHSQDMSIGADLNPYGGLLGVEAWLTETPSPRRPGDLLLIAGDNPSHAFGAYLADKYGRRPARSTYLAVAVDATAQFFDRVAGLKPTAVGLWTEDFFRALAPPPSEDGTRDPSNAGRFATWLADNAKNGLPTLASNAAIRVHASKLNVIEAHGVRLEIAGDRSVAWTTRMSLAVPCDAEDLAYTVAAVPAEGSNPPAVRPLAVVGEGRCHADIAFDEPLRPGRRYGLTITRARTPDAMLSFSTDRALTPSSTGQPFVDAGSPAKPIVISMVDPAIRAQLPASYWEWTNASTGGLSCEAPGAPGGTADKCEIVLLDPRSAFNTIRAWQRQRYFALMSGLSDEDTIAILNSTDLIKFVVLSTETQLLGAGTLARDKFSGTTGNVSILDGGAAPAARIWGRPEWVGETVITMSADVTRAAREWHLTSPAASSTPIRGHRLCAVAAGDTVDYFAASHGSIEDAVVRDPAAGFPIARERLYPPFVPDRTYDGVNKQGDLWIDRNEFASMVLDRMRDGLHAELALFPSDTVDEDYIAYFGKVVEEKHALNWMSREMLRRALFRAERVVRIRLSGSDLISTLGTMTARARDEGRSYCVAGIGAANCSVSRISRDSLLVNGRTVVSDHFYSVAMPAGVAARFGLEPDEQAEDLVELVDRKFAGAIGRFNTCDAHAAHVQPDSVTPNVEPLALRLEESKAKRMQPYLRFAPLEFTLQNTELEEPRDGSFAQTTIEGRDAKDRRTFSAGTAVDLGIDWRRATWRVLGGVRQGRDRIEDPSSGRIIRSEDPDEYSAGTRLDWKVKPFAPSVRFFAGGFVEGELIRDRFDDIAPRPSGVLLRRYVYGTAGAEVDNVISRRFFRLRQVRLSFNTGKAFNERTRVLINGEEFDLSRGLSSVVRNYKKPIDTISFVDVDGMRNRIEVATLATVPFYKAFGRDAQLEVTARGRAWMARDDVILDLAESKSLRTIWKLLFPVNRLFSLGFEADNHVVWSEQGDRFMVWRTKALVSIPLFTKRSAGFIW